jgi:uncharacterized YigZ family protein
MNNINEPNNKDNYREIDKCEEFSLFKDKGSKFFGYAFKVHSEEDVKVAIEELKKEHHSARHHCYAYIIGENEIKFRANDDGEPSKTAGMPILGQIQSKDLTNILVVVVRYFGGVKLGVGGLINAYKNAAKEILDTCSIVEKTIDDCLSISGDYSELNNAMRFVKEYNLNIHNQKMEEKFTLEMYVRKRDSEEIFEKANKMHKLNVKLT